MTGPVTRAAILLDTREERVAVDDERQRLDDAGVGIGLHGGGEAHDAVAGHEAVRIEHERVLVMPAPARHEVGDVAGLAVMVLRPMAIIEPCAGAEALPQGQEGALLRDPGIRMRRIGEDEIIEMLAEPGRLDRLVDRLEGCVGAVSLLVVDGHDDRGSVLQGGWQGAAMAAGASGEPGTREARW